MLEVRTTEFMTWLKQFERAIASLFKILEKQWKITEKPSFYTNADTIIIIFI